jgi:hypothetical protein
MLYKAKLFYINCSTFCAPLWMTFKVEHASVHHEFAAANWFVGDGYTETPILIGDICIKRRIGGVSMPSASLLLPCIALHCIAAE